MPSSKVTHWTLIARGTTCRVSNGVLPRLHIIRIGSDCAYQDQTGALELVYGTTEGDHILTERRDLLQDFNYQMLRGLLNMAAALDTLPYLGVEESNVPIPR